MRKHRADRVIAILTFILMAIGLVIIYAIGPLRANSLNAAYGTHYNDQYFFIRQAVSVVLSIFVFFAAYKFPYRKLRKFSEWLMRVALFLCFILAIAQWTGLPIARCELGACRWFNFFGLSLQPAEILKIGTILFLAVFLAEERKNGELGKNTEFWLKFWTYFGLSMIFVVGIQKDLGSGVPIVVITFFMLFMAGANWKTLGTFLLVIALAGAAAIVMEPHRIQRVATFIGGETAEQIDESADAYHINNALIAIGTGGLFGRGIGNSVQATGYLPESINDSVFAVLGETFGFVGLVVIVGVFAWLLLRLLKVSDSLADLEESLVVIGVFSWIMTHMVVNIMAMTDLIPLTGITLPLLSYGGTSMMCVAFGLGLAMQLSCYTSRRTISDKERQSNDEVFEPVYTGAGRRMSERAEKTFAMRTGASRRNNGRSAVVVKRSVIDRQNVNNKTVQRGARVQPMYRGTKSYSNIRNYADQANYAKRAGRPAVNARSIDGMTVNLGNVKISNGARMRKGR